MSTSYEGICMGIAQAFRYSYHALARSKMALGMSTCTRSFTTSSSLLKKGNQPKTDSRITLIRYHMQHPLMPRPLRLSRGRALRHWTIARAWKVWDSKRQNRAKLELQRQYQSIQDTMEVLRNLDDGSSKVGKEGSRLYRIALEKKGIYSNGSIPIEYSRLQTDTPATSPWDHDWKR
ncbi:unnamed protein product [Blumeria hordei]|uniref:Uncharacterized protein n=2 Tax=Blumeria hordei TaxID=2867405 RepID=A0A383UJC6_BLUHO|nr:hypothetical protein BGHDH14_bgh05020 [Blumeria hordei DH14]SZE99337.1 unnamed protein product [Blumeria hordei]